MTEIDTESFRLRSFVERLVAAGECVIHDAPIELVDVAAVLDAEVRAVWFTQVGAERAELVGNVMGSRHRLALSLGTSFAEFPKVLRERLAKPIAPIEMSRAQAPVQEIVLTGAEADLTALPVNLQHELDGAPYISSSIDYALDTVTGWTNLGCRRMMLTGRATAGVDLNAPSDLRALYARAVEKGENMPVAFTVASHPADFLAAVAVTVPMNEFDVIGAVRGRAVPIVKCVTQDVYVPADAEMVLEGYFDPRGLVEPEGPYGEFIGYYGAVKRNPLFHLTAITKRRNALFQTVTIGGRNLGRTDTSVLGSAKTEAALWDVLRLGVREPVSVCATASSGGMYNVRVSIRQRYPGEARNAIAAVFASIGDVKHVFVVDHDVDVFSDTEVDWALATRFQADRDIVVASGFRAVPLDPSLAGSRTGAKAGFDCTIPFASRGNFEFRIPTVPVLGPKPETPQTIESLLAGGPLRFVDLMTGLGSRDGREIIRQFDTMMAAGTLQRTTDGRYELIQPKDR